MPSPYTAYTSRNLPSSVFFLHFRLPLLLLTFPLLRLPPAHRHPLPLLHHSSTLSSPPLLFTCFDCTNHLYHKFSLYFLISRFLACILFSRWVERIYAVWIFSWNVCMIFGRSMSIRKRSLEGF